ncbi:flagellin N-terminal helical domain-containing protein [Bradyrhizobium sp. AZCC 2289]|uniref:flagellin N-terminal helical domain-containing protein n=1 Tax=Bradyrhizobium sp. AZCC 2289 TaxID=3117026 RepID=UPI002FF02083
MSGIVLSAAVRQNLLSLQSTAELLSSTQNRLASGKKVNTALDNPTNFFTAQGLDNRASDINNLLDSIGNGVQVLQAANTGLTSLQKLVDTAKSIANQVLQTTTGYTVKSSATSLAPAGAGALGVVGTAADLTVGGTNSLNAKTFIFTPATGAATTITLGTGAGNVNSINAFNTALSAAGLGLTASFASDGSITLTSVNDNASQTLTTGAAAAADNIAIGGTDTATLVTPAGGAAGQPLADANSQVTRANLVNQYNNIIAQITTTSQDASFNGINLLFGDDLKLTFNETGKSTLTIPGVTYDAAGLGLAPLTAGTDFLDNSSANAVIAKVSAASDQLRSEASALGSNLSIVQIRQDFAKNLINVLQTGSANLTLADTNEEAANSQALSTRQSIAVSALALSNQSQQSVLQLLR